MNSCLTNKAPERIREDKKMGERESEGIMQSRFGFGSVFVFCGFYFPFIFLNCLLGSILLMYLGGEVDPPKKYDTLFPALVY